MHRMLRLVVTLAGLSLVLASSAQSAALVSFGPAAATWGGSGATSVPIAVVSPPNDPRLFVVQRGGVVRIAQDGVVRPTPFLTVPGVDTAGERGLLSIAFPWDYATSGRFYVFASIAGSPAVTKVLEYRVSSSDPNVADPASARTVLTQQLSSATNHNGGQLVFGPDWRLYVTLGDNTNRPAVQDTASLLGKVLRIDPTDPDGDGAATYSVPSDNPFPGNPVWAFGLRNPYRAAFDTAGRLIISDVGEVTWEEINIGVAGGNYGWGPRACDGAGCGEGPNPIDPFYAYPHSDNPGGCSSIIGGVAVRDSRITGLTGRYLFGDFCKRNLRSASLTTPGGDVQTLALQVDNSNSLIGFGDDARGCAYALADGTVYRVANDAGDGLACGLPYASVPADPHLPSTPGPGTGAPPVTTTTPTTTTTPPATAPATTPVKTVPKNCVRGGEMSIRPSQGKITAVRIYRGRKTKAVKFKRNGTRVELRGLPAASKVKLRLSVRLRPGKTVRVVKTFRACR